MACHTRNLPTVSSLLLFFLAARSTASKPRDAANCGSDCLWKSLFSPTLDVESLYFHASYVFTTPAHQNSWGYVNFNLTNAASPFVTECSAQSDQLQTFFYGTQWYTCPAPSGAPNGTAASFRYQFSETDGRLDVNKTWVCEEDGQTPVTFEASGSIQFNLTCNTTIYNNPTWTSGQIYSDTEIVCQPVNLTVSPYVETAVWPGSAGGAF